MVVEAVVSSAADAEDPGTAAEPAVAGSPDHPASLASSDQALSQYSASISLDVDREVGILLLMMYHYLIPLFIY